MSLRIAVAPTAAVPSPLVESAKLPATRIGVPVGPLMADSRYAIGTPLGADLGKRAIARRVPTGDLVAQDVTARSAQRCLR